MELQKIKVLLERYLEGETTLTEEQQLRDYFSQDTVAPDLVSYKPLFSYFNVAHKEQFKGSFSLPNSQHKKPAIIWLAAAASIALLATAVWYGNGKATYNNDLGTYEDPQLALQKTKDILNLVSHYMHEGNDELVYITEIEMTKNKLVHDNNKKTTNQ